MDLEVDEITSAPITPRPAAVAPAPPVSIPTVQYNSPSLTRAPLLISNGDNKALEPTSTNITSKSLTPKTRTPYFITPIGSPIRRAFKLTKLDPQDAWLPITESRNGNAYYAAFHVLCSGIGIQALVLPVSFTILGW